MNIPAEPTTLHTGILGSLPTAWFGATHPTNDAHPWRSAPRGSLYLSPSGTYEKGAAGWTSAGSTALNVLAFGADPTGTTGSGAAINAALAAAAADKYQRVYIPAGYYLIDETIVHDSLIWLHGDGMATYLRAADGLNAPMIQAYYSAGVRWSYMQRISDMRLDGNRDNQNDDDADICHGIEWIAPDGTTAPILVDELVGYTYVVSDNYEGQWFDSNRDAFNLWISYCAGAGFYQSGRGGGHFHNITTYECAGYGFHPTYDTTWNNCTAGRNGKAGFYIAQSAVRMNGCKAWWSGYRRPTSYADYLTHGFMFTATTRGSAANGCEAQDNYSSGFAFNLAIGHAAYNCIADSNNRRNGDNAGVDFYESYGNAFTGQVYDRYNDDVRYQDYAIRLRSNSIMNTIHIQSRYYNGGATAGGQQLLQHISTDTDSLQGNDIVINNQNGMQKIGSGIVTPSVFHGGTVLCNLSQNTTVNYDPTGTLIPPGARLKFTFVQDGTGGRTVTFSGTYYRYSWTPDTAANKVNTIEFTWNHELSKWIQSATTTGM